MSRAKVIVTNYLREPLKIENEILGGLDEVIARVKACSNVRRVLLGEQALNVANGIPKES